VSSLSRHFVLDASVFVADARPSEPGHADANALLIALAGPELMLYIPNIAQTEIASALARALDDADLALETATMYRSWPGAQVEVVDETLGDLAARLAAEHRLRGCDAIYVALAQARDAVLVSFDREQLERSPADLVARTPGEVLADLAAT